MAAMIVFTPNCPSEGDISRLECTERVKIQSDKKRLFKKEIKSHNYDKSGNNDILCHNYEIKD